MSNNVTKAVEAIYKMNNDELNHVVVRLGTPRARPEQGVLHRSDEDLDD